MSRPRGRALSSRWATSSASLRIAAHHAPQPAAAVHVAAVPTSTCSGISGSLVGVGRGAGPGTAAGCRAQAAAKMSARSRPALQVCAEAARGPLQTELGGAVVEVGQSAGVLVTVEGLGRALDGDQLITGALDDLRRISPIASRLKGLGTAVCGAASVHDDRATAPHSASEALTSSRPRSAPRLAFRGLRQPVGGGFGGPAASRWLCLGRWGRAGVGVGGRGHDRSPS